MTFGIRLNMLTCKYFNKYLILLKNNLEICKFWVNFIIVFYRTFYSFFYSFLLFFFGFHVNLRDFKEKIKDVIQLEKGGSYSLAVELIYYTRLFKYVRKDQYKTINPRFKKISDPDRLAQFVKIGVLEVNDNVYKATEETTELLADFNYNVKLLPKIPAGYGDINQTSNTEYLIQSISLPHFKHISYPHFSYVIPDALLIRHKETKIKFDFLEIEAKKPNWSDYLLRKKKNYLLLSEDEVVFRYCSNLCDHLKLPKLRIDKFNFTVVFVSQLKYDFGKGFVFIDKLEHL